MSISLYVMMSIAEEGVPDWDVPAANLIRPEELVLDLDDTLREEIVRMESVADEMVSVCVCVCKVCKRSIKVSAFPLF